MGTTVYTVNIQKFYRSVCATHRRCLRDDPLETNFCVDIDRGLTYVECRKIILRETGSFNVIKNRINEKNTIHMLGDTRQISLLVDQVYFEFFTSIKCTHIFVTSSTIPSFKNRAQFLQQVSVNESFFLENVSFTKQHLPITITSISNNPH